MNKPCLAGLGKRMGLSVRKHCPEILQGIGIAGMITTTVLAVRATPKAVRLIREDSRNTHDGDEKAYTKKEAVKSAWKCYIPAALTCTASVACLIFASSVGSRKNAALAAAYTLSETGFKEYREKVAETIGDKKEKAIRDDIDKDRIAKDPVGRNEIVVTGKGQTLCYDVLSGRYFYSDIDKLRKAENELNKRMRDEMTVTINELFEELGLSDISIGNSMGWDINRGYIDLSFSSQITEEIQPCLVVGHNLPPVYF